MLTIVTWLWNQNNFRTKYTNETVIAMKQMVDRYYRKPHRFVCMTDHEIPGIETFPIGDQFNGLENPTWKNGPSCYRRLIAFKKNIGKLFGPRFVSIDLDTIIMGDVTPLWDREEEIVLLHTSENVPYCGTMWMMNSGCRPKVWSTFDPVESPKLTEAVGFRGSDQAWLAYSLGPGEATWNLGDDIKIFTDYTRNLKTNRNTAPDCRILFFNGKYKPWDPLLRRKFPWLAEHYPYEMRGDETRMCVVNFDRDIDTKYRELMRVFRKSMDANNPDIVIDEIDLGKQMKDITRNWTYTSNTLKMREWVKYIESATGPVIFSDSDMLALESAQRAFDENPDFDVAITGDLTRKKFPINGGIVFVRPTKAGKAFIRAWADANEELYRNPQLHHRYINRWAGMNQAAFGYLMDKGYPKCNLIFLPLQRWNATDDEWTGVNDDTVFVHIKGDLRTAVLDRAAPRGPLRECMRKWYQYAGVSDKQYRRKSPKASNRCIL